MGTCVAPLSKERLSEEVMFEDRILGGGNSKLESQELGKDLTCSRNSKTSLPLDQER